MAIQQNKVSEEELKEKYGNSHIDLKTGEIIAS